jgi:hypothetical protein
MWLGTNRSVVLNTYELVTEGFATDALADRNPGFYQLQKSREQIDGR